MPALHVGCPMWAHRPWAGLHLPEHQAQGTEMAAYSRLLNAVEGNTTFYASPSPAIVQRWGAQAFGDFRFVFKVPREITHDRRLRDIAAPLHEFVDLMAPLGDRIGGFTFQLPATFAPKDLGALDDALRIAPSGWRWSVEVRHPDLFSGPARTALDRLLARHGAERVLMDTTALFRRPPFSDAGREAWAKKPRVPLLTEALTDQPVVRFIGNDDEGLTVDGLNAWEAVVAAWLADGRSPTVFVHTPDNLQSPRLARAFHTRIAMLVDDLDPLPEPLPVVDQASLF